jgi:hypothetical protein
LPGYSVGSGDLTAFVLRSASLYGARPAKTTGLPKTLGEWRYKADKDGIQVQLVGDHLADIQSALLVAFGAPAVPPKTNADGQIANGIYAAPVVGAAIEFGHQWSAGANLYTEVLIVRQSALK